MGKIEKGVKYFLIRPTRFCLWQTSPLLLGENRPLLEIESLSKNLLWDFWKNEKSLCMSNTTWYNLSRKKISPERIFLHLPQKEG
jgi:hypothetical protein